MVGALRLADDPVQRIVRPLGRDPVREIDAQAFVHPPDPVADSPEVVGDVRVAVYGFEVQVAKLPACGQRLEVE